MATKINAADIMTMTFNADPFDAHDVYDEEELQEMLDKAYITELSGDDAEQARVMLDYHADSNVRVFKGIMPDAAGYYNGDVFYFSVKGDSPALHTVNNFFNEIFESVFGDNVSPHIVCPFCVVNGS